MFVTLTDVFKDVFGHVSQNRTWVSDVTTKMMDLTFYPDGKTNTRKNQENASENA